MGPTKPLPASSLLAVYAALGAAWEGLARWAVPPVIDAAYHGRSLGPLNAVFRGRAPHPVEHYFDLWSTYSGAVLLALALHLSIVLFLRRPGPRHGEGVDHRWGAAFGVASTVFLAACVLSGPRHDYVADLEIWDVVLRGGDPWWLQKGLGWPLNAYGPLFNLLAVLTPINPLAPKLLFACAYLLFQAWLLRRFPPRGGRAGSSAAVLIAALLNPFVWVEVPYYGHWDVLVGAACVAAVHQRIRGRDVASGVALGLGILLKYIPVVLLPFLALDGRRVRARLLLASLATVALGLGASVLVWGPATFRPIAFAAGRGSSFLSVFRFLRGRYSPLRLAWPAPDVDPLALPCLAAAGLSVFLWCQWRRVGPARSAVLAVLTTLLFYQVGFTQYQMVLYLLVSYWLLRAGPEVQGDRLLRVALAGYFGWIALYSLVTCVFAGAVMDPRSPWNRVEDVVGLPTFLLGGFLLVTVVRARSSPSGLQASGGRQPPVSGDLAASGDSPPETGG